MGLTDVFGKEDRVEVTFSSFYKLMRESAKAELIINAVNCDVPHQHIREMATGKKECLLKNADIEAGKNADAGCLMPAT